MDGAVGAAGERLTDDLSRTGRSGRAGDNLPPVLFLQPESLFERVGIRLVQLERGIVVPDPRFAVVHAQLPFTRNDLFYADGYFHTAPAANSQVSALLPAGFWRPAGG